MTLGSENGTFGKFRERKERPQKREVQYSASNINDDSKQAFPL